MKSKCVIIAGEFSADVLGVEIMSAINNIEWYGIGGPLMDATEPISTSLGHNARIGCDKHRAAQSGNATLTFI